MFVIRWQIPICIVFILETIIETWGIGVCDGDYLKMYYITVEMGATKAYWIQKRIITPDIKMGIYKVVTYIGFSISDTTRFSEF